MIEMMLNLSFILLATIASRNKYKYKYKAISTGNNTPFSATILDS